MEETGSAADPLRDRNPVVGSLPGLDNAAFDLSRIFEQSG
jgi:hypothetical protein